MQPALTDRNRHSIDAQVAEAQNAAVMQDTKSATDLPHADHQKQQMKDRSLPEHTAEKQKQPDLPSVTTMASTSSLGQLYTMAACNQQQVCPGHRIIGGCHNHLP